MKKEDFKNTSGGVSKNIRYDVRIKTSDYSKIDNGLAIDMILVGMESENFNKEETILQSHRIKLNSTPSDHEKEKFLKGNLDLFRLEANDVGRVRPVFNSLSTSDFLARLMIIVFFQIRSKC